MRDFLLILSVILNCNNKFLLANKVTCQYEDSDISIFSMKVYSDYSCEISLEFENFENITEIDGEHEESEKTDGDVKFLQSYCPSKIYAFTSIFCNKFNNLEAMKIENVEIKQIDESSLQKCPNLKLIHLNGNEVYEIPEGLLSNNSNLVEIVISSNQINSFGENTFEKQENLQKLFLHNNKIESLPSGIFKNLKNLKKLNLDDNKIEVLDAEWFSSLNNLITLSINSNKITHLPQNVFEYLNNLQMLHLDHNSLTVLNSNSFGNRDKLTQICVNFNKIDAVDPEMIQNSSLSKLRMEDNTCFSEIIESRDQMEEKLKTCFDNFNLGISVHDASNSDNNATFDEGEILQVASAFGSEIQESNTEIDYDEPNNENATTVATTTSTESLTTTKIKEITTVASRIAEKPLNCGKADASIADNDDENKFARGTYPWSSAIMKHGQVSPCNGVLISEKKVITAAKCLYKFDERTEKVKELDSRDVVVILGGHNIHNRTEKDKIIAFVSTIHIHNEYDFMADKMDADIAVIVLKQKIKFTKFIQPICMMNPNDEIKTISEGVVVSFGHQEAIKNPTFTPKKIISKIYENSICPSKNEGFSFISSNRTFCGGDSKGIGVCIEDIGSGLVVKYDGHYYLRGIVSVVVGGNEGVCDDTTYTLFTDVTKYTNWIENVSDDTQAGVDVMIVN